MSGNDMLIKELMALPIELSVMIASGYAGYYIAHLGRREHHDKTDLFLSTAIYGFISWGVYKEVYKNHSSYILAVGAALIISMIIGAIWNGFGRSKFSSFIRWARITQSDNLKNAWQAIPDAKGYDGVQLSVVLTNGIWLHCDDLARFKECPNGPCIFGADGDLLMYVTHTKLCAEKNFVEEKFVSNQEFGDDITYIPKSQIARVQYRRILSST